MNQDEEYNIHIWVLINWDVLGSTTQIYVLQLLGQQQYGMGMGDCYVCGHGELSNAVTLVHTHFPCTSILFMNEYTSVMEKSESTRGDAKKKEYTYCI